MTMAPPPVDPSQGASSGPSTKLAPDGSGGGGSGGGGTTLFISGGGAHGNADGSYSDIVGDGNIFYLQGAQNGRVLESVTWTITGPGPVVQTQTYTLTQGGNTNYTFPKTDPTPDGVSDEITAYWGAVPGNYTITAKANYFDGSDTVTAQVNVVAPKLNSLSMTQLPMKVGGPYQAQEGLVVGLHQGDLGANPPTYGDVVSASITMPNAIFQVPGGYFAFLQMVNLNTDVTNNVTGRHTMVSNKTVLDDTGLSWFQNTWVSATYPSSSQTITVPPPPAQGQAPAVRDDPEIAEPPDWVGNPQKDYYTKIQAQSSFSTYLMFRPYNGTNNPGSIYVPLGVVNWKWQASAQYNAATNQYDWTNNVQRDPPDTGATRQGATYTGDVSWTTNAHQVPWNPPYPPT
jgi:hypothetical protein